MFCGSEHNNRLIKFKISVLIQQLPQGAAVSDLNFLFLLHSGILTDGLPQIQFSTNVIQLWFYFIFLWLQPCFNVHKMNHNFVVMSLKSKMQDLDQTEEPKHFLDQ